MVLEAGRRSPHTRTYMREEAVPSAQTKVEPKPEAGPVLRQAA